MTKPVVYFYYGGHDVLEIIHRAIKKESPDENFDNYYMSAGSDDKLCYHSAGEKTTSAYIELSYGCSIFKPDVLLALLTNDKSSPHFRREYTHVFIVSSTSLRTFFEYCNADLLEKLVACVTIHDHFEYTFSRTSIKP